MVTGVTCYCWLLTMINHYPLVNVYITMERYTIL